MNEDLNSLTKWLRINKLKLNVSKTKYRVVTKRRPLEEVETVKYLGVQIDNRLTFKEHLDLLGRGICEYLVSEVDLFNLFRKARVVVNDEIPNSQKLRAHRIAVGNVFCSRCNYLDNNVHRLKKCIGAREIWYWLTSLLRTRLNLTLSDPDGGNEPG
jgi:hypothetical protein